MFSESKAGRGEQRGFKHMPHFFPWLCSGLKTHQTGGGGGGGGGGGDLGLEPSWRGAFRRSAGPRLEDLVPQGRIKEEIKPGRDKEEHRKSVPRGNGVGLARRLPLVLRGRHILSEGLGKAKGDGPGKKDPSPEPVPNSDSGTRPAVRDGPRDPDDGVPVRDFNSEPSPVRTPGRQLSLPSTPQSGGVGPPPGKYGPPAPGPAPVPVTPGKQVVQEAPDPAVPSPRSAEAERERLSVFLRRTYRQRDPTFSCWINPPAWSTIDRQRGFKSSVGGPPDKSTDSPGLRPPAGRDQLPGGRFNHRGSFKGDVLSRERPPHTDTGFTRTLPGRRKPRPKSELLQRGGPEQVWVQPRAGGAVDSTGAAAAAAAEEEGQLGASCHRKAVRSQIKRVVVNLEQVVGALRNVQQEMKEVVEQIDYLTSAIDLNAQEEETGGVEPGEGGGGGGGRGDVPGPPGDSCSASASSTSGVTVLGVHPPERSGQEEEDDGKGEEAGCTPASASTLKRGHRPRDQTARPAPCVRTPVRRLSEKTPAPPSARTAAGGSSQRRGAPPSYASSPINRAVQSHPLPQRPPSQRLAPSPRRHSSSSPGPSPARPPAPGPSPLLVGPASAATGSSPPPPSPLATPSPSPALSLSLPRPSPVAVHALSGSCESPLSRHPSARPASPSPSPSPARPPAPSGPPGLSEALPARPDRGGEESQAGPGGGRPRPATRESAALPERTRDPPAGQGRRGRRPPPYPHGGLFERGRRAKDPRQAPPYPEKRRLLSTTV